MDGWMDGQEIQRLIDVTGRRWIRAINRLDKLPPPLLFPYRHPFEMHPSINSRGEEEVGNGLAPAGLLEQLRAGPPQPVVGVVARHDEAVVSVDCLWCKSWVPEGD